MDTATVTVMETQAETSEPHRRGHHKNRSRTEQACSSRQMSAQRMYGKLMRLIAHMSKSRPTSKGYARMLQQAYALLDRIGTLREWTEPEVSVQGSGV